MSAPGASVSPPEAAGAGCQASCSIAGSESGGGGGETPYTYEWYKATASGPHRWMFDRWTWVWHIEETDAEGHVTTRTEDRSDVSNPMERHDDYDFGDYRDGPNRYGEYSHTWPTDVVAHFVYAPHIGTGYPVYNEDGTIRSKGGQVAYDNDI